MKREKKREFFEKNKMYNTTERFKNGNFCKNENLFWLFSSIFKI